MGAAEQLKLSYQDYLALERDSDQRYEYLDGEVWLMAGGTPRHSKLKINAASLLNSALGNGPCQAYDADLKVRVAATGLATYPDLTIVCGGIERHPEDANAVTNPTLALEVLSGTTERWDRGGKFLHFQQIPSLKHFVLVGQDEPQVEVFTRAEGGAWTYRRYGAGERVALGAVGLELEVDALYRNLPD